MNLRSHVSGLLTALGLCLIGPAALHGAAEVGQTSSHWWQQLGDSTLTRLVNEGLDANADVAMAARRINIASQALASARAAYYPTVDVQAGWSKTRSEQSQWNLSGTVSWEIDVFGKVTTAARQKKALVNVSLAELAATELSVAASIAQAYVQLRMYQAEKAMNESHVGSQSHVAKMVKARYEADLGTRLDVAQAQYVLHSTQAGIPPIETSIAQTVNALAVLLNVNPDVMRTQLEQDAPLPSYAQVIANEVPAEQLRRRPDVMQAEAELESYAAALGVARKDFLPSLSINGTIGTAAHGLGDLFTDRSWTYTVSPTLTWTVFDSFARRANAIAAREQMEIGVENYQLTILNAVEEVDNAIVAYGNTLRRIELLEKTVADLTVVLEKSIDLYKIGLASFTTVMDAQINLLGYQTQLVEARASALTALITYHKALGE